MKITVHRGLLQVDNFAITKAALELVASQQPLLEARQNEVAQARGQVESLVLLPITSTAGLDLCHLFQISWLLVNTPARFSMLCHSVSRQFCEWTGQPSTFTGTGQPMENCLNLTKRTTHQTMLRQAFVSLVPVIS